MPSRLDYSASGVVLVSKSPETHAALQRLFERRRISKQYLLEVEGIIPWQQKYLAAPITKHSEYSFLRQVSPPLSGEGLAAITRFERVALKPDSGRSLFAAFPQTGRTHQIRIHAAYLSFPIVGDCFYGGPPATSLHLLSYRWKLTHPISQKPLDITLPSHLVPGWAHDNAL